MAYSMILGHGRLFNIHIHLNFVTIIEQYNMVDMVLYLAILTLVLL